MEKDMLRSQCDSYVLGLLEGTELAEIQALIDKRDPECLELLRESNELIGEIGLTAPLVEPPALIRSQIVNAIRASSPAAPAPAPRRSNWVAWAGWAVAAGAVFAAFTFNSQLERERQTVAQLNGEMSSMSKDAAHTRKVLSILMARDARIIRLASTAPEAPQFRAFWSGPSGLVLTGLNVPKPAQGRTFQLWVVPKSGNPISAGVFAPSDSGQVLVIADVTANPGDAAALAITDEPDGGSAQPTTKPTFVGPLAD